MMENCSCSYEDISERLKCGQEGCHARCKFLTQFCLLEDLPELKALDSQNWVEIFTDASCMRAGALTQCSVCLILLDAIATYSTEWLLEDSAVCVIAARTNSQSRIRFFFADCVDCELDDMCEIFQAKGMSLISCAIGLTESEEFELHETSKWLAAIPTLKIPSGDTSSEIALLTISSWLEGCLENHPICRNNIAAELPKRVLELTQTHFILREGLQKTAKYACLSHCWGINGPALRLNSATFSSLKAGLSLDSLPKTFRDTADVCSRLGIHYLWIDAICIKQDDQQDWIEAAAGMGDIYENAFLTIAASGSSNSEIGLFAPETHEYKAKKMSNTSLYVRKFTPDFPTDLSAGSNDKESCWPLLYRAWTYQERRLSPRTVHFGKYQIYWECRTEFSRDDGIATLTDPLGSDKRMPMNFNTTPQSAEKAWRKTVMDYTQMKLTYESDCLPALAAIVERKMRTRQGDAYIAGMWKASILQDLPWYVHVKQYDKRRLRPGVSLPSWSWASSLSPVFWRSEEWKGNSEVLPATQIIDLSYDHVGPSNIGEVSNAYLRIQGPVVQMTNTPGRRTHPSHEDRFTIDAPCLDQITFSLYLDGEEKMELPEETLSRTILLLTTCKFEICSELHGLVLQKINETEFERVGFVEFHLQGILSEIPMEVQSRLQSKFVASLTVSEVTIT